MKTLQRFIVLLLLYACTSPSDAQTVYITKTGKKYHTTSCQYLAKSKIAIAMKDAVDRDYTPCSRCEPGSPPKSSDTQQKTEVKKGDSKPAEKSSTQSTQCSARTKEGTRCKRMTTYANGKCYQHQ